MTSKTDLCNQALSRVGAANIFSFDDDAQKEAVESRNSFQQALDLTISAHDWSFARKYVTLALVSGEAIPGWDFAYGRPADCHQPREIVFRSPSYGATPGAVGDYDNNIQYEECLGTLTNRRIIATNQEGAVLRYTIMITDLNLLDAMAKEALISKLASDFAVSIKGKPELQRAWFGGYQSAIAAAMRLNSNADNKAPKPQSTIVTSRG